mmetsp:Transcript_58147/g.92368  ORF Transcript_58147/g.92368 Transcript_58147/m.92368 type:complete len:195 (-) Transcript_58147:133-717(-)|eukprot:CAMPEP_0197042042 /NCGR_PEP_ID=MMETSP1384-20130603/18497_1 /TAXON_ID=29189 /ORGANISM="Ammonia sp." /LENGTH=194 /DNA_ID=CAMNT_0042473079 /DNA_START=1236 /DNA_END=1820 /DNA_ORIENTATION=+
MGCSGSSDGAGCSCGTDGSTAQSNMDKKNHEIQEWLDKLELGEYFANFIQHGYAEMSHIANMHRDHLKQIGVMKIGHQVALLAAIKQWKEKHMMSVEWDSPCFTLNSSLNTTMSEDILIPSWQCEKCDNQNGLQRSECQLCGHRLSQPDLSALHLKYPKNKFVYKDVGSESSRSMATLNAENVEFSVPSQSYKY